MCFDYIYNIILSVIASHVWKVHDLFFLKTQLFELNRKFVLSILS